MIGKIRNERELRTIHSLHCTDLIYLDSNRKKIYIETLTKYLSILNN